MSQGYICLHRKIRDNWLWKKKPFSPGQAWVDMLLLADHADIKIAFKENVTLVLRGEFIHILPYEGDNGIMFEPREGVVG